MKLSDAIHFFASTETGKQFNFTAEESGMADNVTKLPKYLYEAVQMSGESNGTGSKVIPSTKSFLQLSADPERKLQSDQPTSFASTLASATLVGIP